MTRPARCDLSRGHRDRSAGAHDHRPPDPPGRRLPAQAHAPVRLRRAGDTPRRRTGDRAPPGTGPYRVAAWDAAARRGSGPQPALPVVVAAGAARRLRRSHRRQRPSRRGRRARRSPTCSAAPPTSSSSPTRSVVLLPPSASGARGPLAGAAATADPEPVLNYMFLNVHAAAVRRPPRAPRAELRHRPRARRRARGRAATSPPRPARSCPAASPGYEPYCPYTAHAGPGRALDRARHGAGTRARGRVGHRRRARRRRRARTSSETLGRYFAALLDQLGYRASTRVAAARLLPDVFDPAPRAQIGFNGWSADYASPSTFIEPNFRLPLRRDPPTSATAG